MNDKESKVFTPEENLKYQLETLASYDKCDIDDHLFEVMYENGDGFEMSSSVSVVDIASEAVRRIENLEAKLAQYESTPRQKWISVEDNLPDNDTEVLTAFIDDGELIDPEIDYLDHCPENGTDYWANRNDVTHWCPIPTAEDIEQ